MLRLLAVLASLTTVGAAAAHECDAILSSGVRNTYQVLQDGEFRNQFSSSYCDELGSKTGSGNSGGMNVGYKFFTFGASNNSSRNAEQFQKNCGSNSGQMSDAQFVSALQHVADQGIVQAWQQCISSTYGVMITAETASKGRLTVTYRFRAAGNVASAVVRGEPIFDGLTCNEGIKNGTVIDTGGLAQLCRRESEDDEVIIVLNTSFQPATLVIPPLVKPSEVKIPPPPPASTQQTGDGIVLLKDFCDAQAKQGIFPIACQHQGGAAPRLTPLPGSPGYAGGGVAPGLTPLPGSPGYAGGGGAAPGLTRLPSSP